MIWQLKQQKHYEMNKHNYVSSEHTTLSLLLVHCLSTSEESPRTAMGESVRIAKKDSLQLLTFLAQHSALEQAWVIAVLSILSTSTCRNYLEDQNSGTLKFLTPSDNKNKKTLQHSRKNAAAPNYKMRQRTSFPHNTALEAEHRG